MAAAPPANALSKLAESDSESEKAEAIARRTTGRLLSRLQPNGTEDSSDEEQADSDEDAYERTKQRLLAAKETAAASSGDEEEDNGEGAYERMKQRLMASTGLERRLVEEPTRTAQKPATAPAFSSSEDEEDVPVRVNRVQKLQTRRERTKSSVISPSLARDRVNHPLGSLLHRSHRPPSDPRKTQTYLMSVQSDPRPNETPISENASSEYVRSV